MATNTLAGVNLNRISQLTLDALITEGFPLSAFVTDFSGDIQPHGESVTTRFVASPVTQNFASSKATSNSTTTARVITLNNYRGVSIGFKDLERTFSDVDLADMYVRPSIAALVDYVIEEVLKISTQANGFTVGCNSPAADFDADKVADLSEALSTAKVPKFNRHLILPPRYYSALVKDGAIIDASAYGSTDPIREHMIPRLHGFGIIEYNGVIPDNDDDGMVGVATAQQGLCVAARGVEMPPEDTWYGNCENIVEPTTGLPIQIREFYDGNELVYQFSILFGVQKGVTGNTLQIVDVEEEG